jgi:hypothetical protein
MRSREPITNCQLWLGGIRRYRALPSCNGNRKVKPCHRIEKRRSVIWVIGIMPISDSKIVRLSDSASAARGEK